MSENINDLHFLKVFCSKEVYAKYISFVRLDTLSHEVKTLLLDFKEYFDTFNKDITDFNELYAWFSQVKHPTLQETTLKIYKLMITELSETSTEITESVLLEFQKKATKQILEDHFKLGFDIDFVKNTLKEYESNLNILADGEDEDVFTCTSIKELLTSMDKAEGLKWRLDFLNKNLGGLKPGMLVIIAAYVNVGKTYFACSEAAYMATQITDGTVLWLNNEEQDRVVALKIRQSVLNATYNDLVNRTEEAEAEYKKRMHGDANRIKIVDISKKTLLGIRHLFDKYKPKLVIVDQAANIKHTGSKVFNDQSNLQQIFQELRELAKAYCPIIAVCQGSSSNVKMGADGEAEYVLYPHFSNLYSSKVGIQGTADVILMIGQRGPDSKTKGIVIGKSKFCSEGIRQEVVFDVDRIRYRNPVGE